MTLSLKVTMSYGIIIWDNQRGDNQREQVKFPSVVLKIPTCMQKYNQSVMPRPISKSTYLPTLKILGCVTANNFIRMTLSAWPKCQSTFPMSTSKYESDSCAHCVIYCVFKVFAVREVLITGIKQSCALCGIWIPEQKWHGDMSGKNQTGLIFRSSGTNTGIYPRPIKTEFSPLNKKM
jgi:hypothetical protein